MSASKQRSHTDIIGDLREIFRFLGYTFPAMLVLGGILISVIGYQFSLVNAIKASGVLILLGVGLYILEFLIFLIGHYSSDHEEEEPLQLISHQVEDEG